MADLLLSRVCQAFRAEGFRGSFMKALYDLGWRRFLLMRRCLVEPIARPNLPIPVEFHWLDHDQFPADLQNLLMAHPLEIGGDLNAGDRCVVASHQGQLVGVLFASIHQPPWMDTLSGAQNQVYLYGAFTHPHFRGLLVSPALMAEALKLYRNVGIRSAIMLIFSANTPALHASAKLHFQAEAIITQIRLGPFHRVISRRL